MAFLLGWALLIELAAGFKLPGTLLGPLGLAAIVCVSQLLCNQDATAELAAPVVGIGGIIGLAVNYKRLIALRPDRWYAAACAAVYCVLAAPVVFSGAATFAGYGILGDTSIHFVGVDYLMHGGLVPHDVPPSSYQAALGYFNGGYPSGMHTALGSLRWWSGTDVAWVFQPFLAVGAIAAMLGLAPLAEGALDGRKARAIALFLAAIPALAYAYYLQGSIKEIGTTVVLALLGGLIPTYMKAPPGFRRVLPLAVAAGASLAIISLSVAPWLGPILLACLYIALRRNGQWQWKTGALEAVVFAALTAILAIPTLRQLSVFLDVATSVVTSQTEVGNLIRPLSPWQLLPVWPQPDYRFYPDTVLGWMAVGVSAGALALGIVATLRRIGRAWGLGLFGAIGLIAWIYVTHRGSPWADAKALMIFSPAIALLAAVGGLALVESGRKAEGIVLTVLLAAGVVWSATLEYRGANPAPRDRLNELAHIGSDVVNDKGPTLYPDFEEFAKHFLREGQPESPAEVWQSTRKIPNQFVNAPNRQLGSSYDLDELSMPYESQFRSIVIRRSPIQSRPPSIYKRVYQGRYYEVWQRPAGDPKAWLAHDPVVNAPFGNGKTPSCADLKRFARAQPAGATLVAAPALQTDVGYPPGTALPPKWGPFPDAGFAVTGGIGRADATITVKQTGPFDLWFGGSFGRRAQIQIDGKVVGSAAHELEGRGQYLHVGRIESLTPGKHQLRLVIPDDGKIPGASSTNRLIGPVMLTPTRETDQPLVRVPKADVAQLCNRPLDWVDALAAGA